MQDTISTTMNAWRSDAENFKGDKAMFWSGKMSIMINAIARCGVLAISVNVAIADLCREEYDRIIFDRT